MEQKENVGVENLQAEAGAEAQDGEKQTPLKASTVWDKFKDADALAKAYGSLQAEFTRRSQRLKELEKEVENFKAERGAQTPENGGGAEKLKSRLAAKRAERKQFDDFVQELERANVGVLKGAKEEKDAEKPQELNAAGADEQTDAETPQLAQSVNSVDKEAEIRPSENGDSGTSVANDRVTLESVDELYARVQDNEAVRLKIIGEYLSSLGKTGAPLMRGGAGTFAAPPMRAKTIDEAGSMALRFFQKNG